MGAAALNYKEHMTNTHKTAQKPHGNKVLTYVDNSLNSRKTTHLYHKLHSCGKSVVHGACDQGDKWIKVIDCKSEHCPICGQKDSGFHQRRVGRAIPKAQKFADMGYFVIEFPKASRIRYRTKQHLTKAVSQAVRVMKELGYKRGYRAVHFFGDPKCPRGCQQKKWEKGEQAKGCERFGPLDVRCDDCGHTFHLDEAAVEWNPHINLLVDGGFLPADRLEEIKATLRSRMKEPDLIVNYSYIDQADEDAVGKKIHRVKYITRPTFLSYAWDLDMAHEMKDFRTCYCWGSKEDWNTPNTWELQERDHALGNVMSLQKKKCPCCGTSVKWEGIASFRGVREWCKGTGYEMVQMGGGFYLLDRLKEDMP